MKKVYVFLANGFEELEAITIIDVLRRANIQAVSCSITSGREVIGSHKIAVITDLSYKETDFEDADMLVIPGGMPGTSNLNVCLPIKEVIRNHARKGKALGAICAGPLVYGGLGLLKNKKATCFPGFEDLLIGAQLSSDDVVVCDNIITANNPGSAIAFALKIIEFLKGENIRNDISNKLHKKLEIPNLNK